MGYGPRYEIDHAIDGRKVTIIMRPFMDSDATVLAEGISMPRIQSFVIVHGGFDLTTEVEHFEKIRNDQNSSRWIIAIRDGDTEETIGVTGFSRDASSRAETGCVIVEEDWWRKGIISATHPYRTWYAFMELGLYALNSSHIAENTGSGRALRRVGYVQDGIKPKAHLSGGKWRDLVFVSCYNPQTIRVLWPDGDIPPDIIAGMDKTQIALDHVRQALNPR